MLLYKILLLLIALILAGCNNDFERVDKIDLIPFSQSKTGKWGYINGRGEILIDTIFSEQPGFFREGFAIIKNKDGTFDYIDIRGRGSNLHFKAVTPFSEGLACVAKINQKLEYINYDFKTVFAVPFASMSGIFSEGMAKFQDSSGRWGFINKSGRIAIKPAYHYVMSFSEGRAAVAINTKHGIMSGYIDVSGKAVIPLSLKFINLRPFSDGLAAFKSAAGWGYMNSQGATAINPKPEWVETTDFREGFASLRLGNKWGVIDKNGDMIIEAKYDFPVVFYNGLAAVSIAGSAGFVDKSEKLIIEPLYDALGLPFICGNAYVSVDGKYYPINIEGKIIDNTGFKRISLNFNEVFDYESAIQCDYFDFAGYSRKIISTIDSSGINGFLRYSVPDSIMKTLIDDGFEIDSASGRFIAEKYKNYNYEMLSRNSLTITNRGSDTAALRNLRSVNTLGGNGKGKQDYVIKSLLMKLIDAGFRFLQDSSRYVFYTDSSAVLLYTNYNDIILDYYFNRLKHLDSNFKEINK